MSSMLWYFYIMNVHACVCLYRMTVCLRCGIPPRAGVLQWWCKIPLIKSLFLFTFPLFTWLILALSPVCPGGRPASICPSKKANTITQSGWRAVYWFYIYIDRFIYILFCLFLLTYSILATFFLFCFLCISLFLRVNLSDSKLYCGKFK